MKEEKILYCFMNKDFEFIGGDDDITDEIQEAVGFDELAVAKDCRNDLDEPEKWKIVKKRIIYFLDEIVEE